MIFHTTCPSGGDAPSWTTPEWMHTPEEPFCGDVGDRKRGDPGCRCHHDSERVERYIVRPIERGEIGIPEALDRYYNRLPVAGRK